MTEKNTFERCLYRCKKGWATAGINSDNLCFHLLVSNQTLFCRVWTGFRPCTDRTRGLWELHLLLGRSEQLAEAVQLFPDKNPECCLLLPGLSVWCWGWRYMRVNIHPDCRLSTCQTRLIFPGDRGWFPAVRRGERGQRARSTLWWEMVEHGPDVHPLTVWSS